MHDGAGSLEYDRCSCLGQVPDQNGSRRLRGHSAGRAAEIGRAFLRGVTAGLSPVFTPLSALSISRSAQKY